MIHVNVWQKSLKYCKVISFQLIKINEKKNKQKDRNIERIERCTALCLVTQSCLTLCNPMDCSLPGSSVHGDSPGKNTGVGSLSLL